MFISLICLTVLVSSLLVINLIIIRYYHSSWASPSGVILMGGRYSETTTEKIQPGGTSTASFNLKHSTM